MTFQDRVGRWMQACFTSDIINNKQERNYRFLEESLELVQSLGCTKEDCLKLIDYVYSRPIGHPPQEVGGVIITLNALCNVNMFGVNDLGEIELSRCWMNIDKIRNKQVSKTLAMEAK